MSAPFAAQATVDQVKAQQGRMLALQRGSRNRSSSVGRYQINRDTLKEFGPRLGLGGDELYSPEVQDKLMMLIADSQGLQKYRRGEMQAEELRQAIFHYGRVPRRGVAPGR